MRSNSTDREVEGEKDEDINTEGTNENQESHYEEELRDAEMQEQPRRSQRIKQPP